ncbi:putative disease resistance protein RGA4 [Miscanthus floridulus]|uniref:putative disease resistance protein RGA4 n=1 Tax=Miscanthus floridulus TaxID=154761 RepID=UPI003459050C
MAAVLDAFAPYVKKLITDMAQEEVSMMLGVSAEITKLEDNMEGLKAFLTDAERRRITDTSVQRWATKLKNAMYDAADILDLCQLEVNKRRESRGGGSMEQQMAHGCFQPLLFCLRNPVFAHKIGSSIKELNQRLDNVYKEAHKFNFVINLGSHPEQRMSTSEKMTSEFVESAIVGEKIERETRELAQMLTINGYHDIKVVAIVGTGGMGKTTLAQKIFNETTVQGHFKVKIWLSITQHFDEVELLRTAIEHAGGVHGGVQDKTLLSRRLTNTLSMGRFLLVLDDVWSNVAWSNVLSVPVRNASKNQQGNWVHGTNHLKVVGMKIISKCGGLPLAIKVMGGLLSTKPRSEGDWEAVLKHHAWSVAGLSKELDNAIYLSYEDLSPQLKQCFLYCSLFPKGTTILQSQVVPMWISEGFIHPPDRSSSSYDDWLEEIADGYYQELITRNLIEPTKESAVTRYSCTMHDVVRSFAEFMSKEESLVVQDQQDDGVSKISHLRHLRYLHLRYTNISRLPGDIHRMKFLQHIVVQKCPQLDDLPSCITQLLHLRTLSMYGSHDNVLIPKGFGQLKNLRTLYGFRVHLDKNGGTGWCSLEEIGPLSQLRKLSLHGLENVSASSSSGMAMISSKEHLDYLGLYWSSTGFMGLRDETNKQQQQRVVEDIHVS